MNDDLFISYASPDLKFAEAVNNRLTDAGFSVWFDKSRLNPGCDWHREIEEHCEAARLILPILTPRWKQSEWTRYETYGHDLVFPLIFEGDFLVKDARGKIDETASVSTPPLRHLQTTSIDFRRVDDHDWPRLVAAIRTALVAPIPELGKRLTRMRYGHTEHFVGREDKLNEIHEKLWTSPTAALTQGEVQIVTALGGVGKTTLARAYVDRFWRLYPQAFWVDCRLGIETEFAALFDLLFPELANAGLEPNQKAKRAFDELNQPAARPMRLLVLDDAPDEQAVLRWVPRAGRCHTVITSRFAGWSNPREVCNVWVLEPEPAKRLLLARAGRNWEALSSDELAAVDKLAELLGYLPLALEQAAAYIGAPGTSCSYGEYIRRFKTAQKYFLSQQQSRGSTEYPASVYATWRTTIDHLPAGSRAILRMAAFMAPTPIPQALWVKSASIVEEQAREVGPLPHDRPPLDIEIPQWIADLARYSMVQPHRSVENPTFSVHGLVQAVEADSIGKDAVPSWIEKARASLIAYAPDETAEDPKTWPVWDALRPHAERLIELGLSNERVEPSLTLMGALGSLYYGKGLYQLDLQIDEKALGIAKRTLPPNSGDLAHRLLCYGESLHQLGRNGEAEATFRESLAIREKTDGPNSLHVAEDLNYLAVVLRAQGRQQESEGLQRRALAIYEAHGDDADKGDIAKSLNNLAGVLEDQGKPGWMDEAENLRKKAVPLAEEGFGRENPKTLICVTNLASLLAKKGNAKEAVVLFRRAIEGFEPLGTEHQYFWKTVARYANLLRAEGDVAAAEPILRRVVEATEKSGQIQQSQSAADLNISALCFRLLQRFAEAAALLQRAISIENQCVPPNYLRSIRCRNNLAIICMLSDQFDEARRVNVEAWSLRDGHRDVTSGRTLFIRTGLCWLRNENAGHYLGQLRTLLTRPEISCLGGTDHEWQAADILDHLRARLAPEESDLLAAIAGALDEPGKVADLERFDLWRSTSAVPLEAPWPDELGRRRVNGAGL